MNILAAIRRRHRRWIPRLATLLAVAWLGMLWQPCAMAMGMDAGSGHAQHACAHCPAPQHTDCEDAADKCTYADRFDADRRTAKLKSGAGLEDVQHIVLPSCHAAWLPLPSWGDARLTVNAIAPPGPPLNILFCAYLN